VKFVLNSENEGYAGGNNRGMEKADGDYFLLLNNDTEVDPDFLGPLVEMAEKDPRVGVLSPKILYYDVPERVQYAGFTAVNFLTGRNRSLREQSGASKEIYETASAHGAAMMVRKKAVEETGLLFEGFFLCYEEVDWCYRMKKKGYKIIFVGTSRVYHKVSRSIGGEASPLRIKYLNRNRIVFLRRNAGQIEKVIFYIYLFVASIPYHAFFFLLTGKGSLLRAYLEGVREGLSLSAISQNFYLDPKKNCAAKGV